MKFEKCAATAPANKMMMIRINFMLGKEHLQSLKKVKSKPRMIPRPNPVIS